MGITYMTHSFSHVYLSDTVVGADDFSQTSMVRIGQTQRIYRRSLASYKSYGILIALLEICSQESWLRRRFPALT